MTVDVVTAIAGETLFLIIKVSAPLLLVSLCVGLAISIFQAVTSIQEQTLTFVPKVLAIFLTLMLLGNWILTEMSNFMIRLWSSFDLYTR